MRTKSNENQPTFPDVSSLGVLAASQMEGWVKFQTEFAEALRHLNQHCLESLQSEAELVTATAGKLVACRSVPETASACQEFIQQQASLAGEEAKYLMSESQKVAGMTTRLWSNGLGTQPGATT
jgi:hypothetical protein